MEIHRTPLEVPESFTTERLQLRVPRIGDGPDLLDAILESLPHLREFDAYLPWAVPEQTLEMSESFCLSASVNFASRKDFTFLLLERKTRVLIGCAGLHRIDWRVPKMEIGYWCRSSKRGNGYITEAVRALLALGIGHLNAVRVEIITDDKNTASCKVCERAGFGLDGILRSARRSFEGELRDTRIYSFLNTNRAADFRAAKRVIA